MLLGFTSQNTRSAFYWTDTNHLVNISFLNCLFWRKNCDLNFTFVNYFACNVTKTCFKNILIHLTLWIQNLYTGKYWLQRVVTRRLIYLYVSYTSVWKIIRQFSALDRSQTILYFFIHVQNCTWHGSIMYILTYLC